MATPDVLPGAEPMSFEGTTATGVLVIHGFTGNPSSMRGIADAMAALGHHVEMPRLPGHGTTIEDMLDTRWDDWTAEVVAAHARLAARADRIVAVGLSMGGSLTLWAGLELDAIVGLVCINPATTPQADEVLAMIQEMVDDGTEIAPAIGGDIADPDVTEVSYDGAPLRALISFQTDGLAPMADRYGELTVPLLLITSRQDHVVEPSNSELLAAKYGGDVEHVWLERSFHVATQDYDADDIIRRTGEHVAPRRRMNATMLVASLPSPSFNSIDIGPLSLNLYGLMIALGVVAAVWLFGRRLEQHAIGSSDDASAIAVWAVLAGIIGARLYHVVTDWDRFENDLASIPAIWEGGLGIPGGLLFGAPVGMWVARRRGIPIAVAATCAAPAIPLAQAIGRWGNYFNQELYGRPTDLPWALEIDAAHIDTTLYAVGTTFHPTFLYESLWSLGVCLVLLWIDRRFRPAPGQLFVMYIIGYGIGRFWVEGLRIDKADHLAGLRWNQWVALAMVVGGAATLMWMRRHPIAEPTTPAAPPPVDAERDDSDDTRATTDRSTDD